MQLHELARSGEVNVDVCVRKAPHPSPPLVASSQKFIFCFSIFLFFHFFFFFSLDLPHRHTT